MRHLFQRIAPSCLVFIVFLNLTSCALPVNDVDAISTTPAETSLDLTPAPTPEYLISVRPIGRVSITDYNKSRQSGLTTERGIAVGFVPDAKNFSLENSKLAIVITRVAIFIDGAKLSNQSLTMLDGLVPAGGPFVFSWSPVLLPGIHEAKFQLTNDSGEIMEYGWMFVITEK